MKEFTLQTEIWLPRPRDEIFPFFAEARNLETITPPWLKCEVLTPAPIEMRPGALIDYRISVHGLPIRWRTEITEWNPPHHFVDIQLRGPYTFWHHTHTFEERDGGTLCGDIVRYRPRGGALVNWLFVRRDVERIFRYRQERLASLFGSPRPGGSDRGDCAGSTADTTSRWRLDAHEGSDLDLMVIEPEVSDRYVEAGHCGSCRASVTSTRFAPLKRQDFGSFVKASTL